VANGVFAGVRLSLRSISGSIRVSVFHPHSNTADSHYHISPWYFRPFCDIQWGQFRTGVSRVVVSLLFPAPRVADGTLFVIRGIDQQHDPFGHNIEKPGSVSAKTVAAVERLAKADRRLAATVSQWDADLWQLNTPRKA
jgi:hypothetical protein